MNYIYLAFGPYRVLRKSTPVSRDPGNKENNKLNIVKSYMIRRSGENRRKPVDPNFKGVERRDGSDRRSVTDRRKAASANISP
jgi:hypothetical protein